MTVWVVLKGVMGTKAWTVPRRALAMMTIALKLTFILLLVGRERERHEERNGFGL